MTGGYIGYTSMINLISAVLSGIPAVYDSSLLTGFTVALLGYIIIILGAIATIIRLIYDITRQASLEALKGPQQTTPELKAPKETPAQPQKSAEPKTDIPKLIQPPQQTVVPPPIPPMPPQAPPQVKYCAFCGKPIAVNARFCQYCQRAQP